ncbi:MAG: serine--tRNA ligase [bacterium]|nr:serine--tRNA ligase [bacterium]
MIPLKAIEAAPDAVKANCRVRGADVDVDAILRLNDERKTNGQELDQVRSEIKTFSKAQKGAPDEAAREHAKELRRKENELAARAREIEDDLEQRVAWLPNFLDERVPIGGEDANEVVREVGDKPSFDFTPRPHEELGELLDLIDIPRAVNASKSRFYNLKGTAVLLRWGLARMFQEHCAPQGFELVAPPVLTKDRTLFTSGYLPFSQKDNFRIQDEDLSLIGTSEQSLLGMHMDEVLTELPKLYLGDSMCFRTEAGNYGKDVKGILRVHQFYKLEQIVYCHPDEARKWHEICLENEEWLLTELGIPYQVLLMASGDMAAPGRIKYDVEAWIPSQGIYRELTSNTDMGDYQTRRGKIRFKIGKEKGFPHTISATGFSDRILIALLENGQRADGSVVIPEKLRPYMGDLEVIEPR